MLRRRCGGDGRLRLRLHQAGWLRGREGSGQVLEALHVSRPSSPLPPRYRQTLHRQPLPASTLCYPRAPFSAPQSDGQVYYGRELPLGRHHSQCDVVPLDVLQVRARGAKARRLRGKLAASPARAHAGPRPRPPPFPARTHARTHAPTPVFARAFPSSARRRSSGDINSSWNSIINNLNSVFPLASKNLSTPECWAYPDMSASRSCSGGEPARLRSPIYPPPPPPLPPLQARSATLA